MKNLIFFLMLISLNLQAQSNKADPPKIGQRIPDFAFKETKYFKAVELSSESIIGKHTILYFWAKNCGGCIASMPKINEFQREFKDRLQIALVGYQDKELAIQSLYEKIRKKNNLQLTVAFDSTVFNKLSPGSGVPILIWIDNRGVVTAITNSSELKKDNIVKFINNKDFPFIDKSVFATATETKSNFNPKLPLLIYGNGGPDSNYLFRSLLTRANPNLKPYYTSVVNPPFHQIINMPLKSIYDVAYFEHHGIMPDTMFQVPIYEIKDTSVFVYERGGEMRGMFSYSLSVPDSLHITKSKMMKIMQRDLQNYFGFDVHFERRKMPCLSFVIIDTAKVNSNVNDTKKRKSIIKWDKFQGGTLINVPVKHVISDLTMSLPNRPVGFNESGLNENISIEINAYMKDLGQIRQELSRYGFDLIPALREMTVMVFKDEK